MFYESLIDNMEVGKSYTINKENLIFVKNMILDLKDDLEKDAVLTKLVKKYDLEPETSIYLYEGNLIDENVLEIKSKEYLFPFLIDRKLHCYGTNEVIEDNTKFYYKNFNVYSENYLDVSGKTIIDELVPNEIRTFNNYKDFLEFIKLEIENCKKEIKKINKKYSAEDHVAYFKEIEVSLLREMLRVSFRKTFDEPKYYYVGWKDYIKFDPVEDFDFVNNSITKLKRYVKKIF